MVDFIKALTGQGGQSSPSTPNEMPMSRVGESKGVSQGRFNRQFRGYSGSGGGGASPTKTSSTPSNAPPTTLPDPTVVTKDVPVTYWQDYQGKWHDAAVKPYQQGTYATYPFSRISGVERQTTKYSSLPMSFQEGTTDWIKTMQAKPEVVPGQVPPSSSEAAVETLFPSLSKSSDMLMSRPDFTKESNYDPWTRARTVQPWSEGLESGFQTFVNWGNATIPDLGIGTAVATGIGGVVYGTALLGTRFFEGETKYGADALSSSKSSWKTKLLLPKLVNTGGKLLFGVSSLVVEPFAGGTESGVALREGKSDWYMPGFTKTLTSISAVVTGEALFAGAKGSYKLSTSLGKLDVESIGFRTDISRSIKGTDEPIFSLKKGSAKIKSSPIMQASRVFKEGTIIKTNFLQVPTGSSLSATTRIFSKPPKPSTSLSLSSSFGEDFKPIRVSNSLEKARFLSHESPSSLSLLKGIEQEPIKLGSESMEKQRTNIPTLQVPTVDSSISFLKFGKKRGQFNPIGAMNSLSEQIQKQRGKISWGSLGDEESVGYGVRAESFDRMRGFQEDLGGMKMKIRPAFVFSPKTTSSLKIADLTKASFSTANIIKTATISITKTSTRATTSALFKLETAQRTKQLTRTREVTLSREPFKEIYSEPRYPEIPRDEITWEIKPPFVFKFDKRGIEKKRGLGFSLKQARGKKSKKESMLFPMADWLSKSNTEFLTKKPASNVASTPFTRKLYTKSILSGGMRFPTAQGFKMRKSKSLKIKLF